LNGWGTFFCILMFLVSNTALSFSSLPFQAKAWLFLAGTLFPFLFLFWSHKVLKLPTPKLSLASPPVWVWVALVAVAIWVRTFKLTDFHPWPAGDEALQAYFAMERVERWDWQFFYTSGQHPPLLVWVLTWFLDVTPSIPLALWGPPALFSCLTLGMAYPTARQFVGRTEAFLFFLLMAFSYWPMFFGRWCVQGALVPFFEMVCLFFLGLLLKDKGKGAAIWKAGVLGLALGVGSLTFTSWLVVIAGLAPLVFLFLLKKGQQGRWPLLGFTASLALAFYPWVRAAWQEGFGGYAKGMSVAGGFYDWVQQVIVGSSYLTTLFWGPLQGAVGYGSVWGGMLNPFLTLCFLLGLLECLLRPTSIRVRWGMGLGALFLLPGLLTADHVEMYRVIQAMPLLLMGTALGLRSLIAILPSRRKALLLSVLLSISFLLDLAHVVKPRIQGAAFRWAWTITSPDPSHRAFLAFREAERRMGPGLIFTEFLPLARNHTLRVGVYPFNALDRPGLDPSQTRWAGVFVNVHYRPFLERRFPGSQWLGWDQGAPEDGGMVVGILPLRLGDRKVIDRWVAAHRHFHRSGVEAENMFNDQRRYRASVHSLPEAFPLMEGDPFLESLYGEWCAQYHYGNGLKGNIAALERALKRGHPAAHLHYKLGAFRYMEGDRQKAKEAFRAAMRLPLDLTAAKRVLEEVGP